MFNLFEYDGVNVNDADNANNDGGFDDAIDVDDEEETCAEHVGGDADTARAHC